MTDHLTLQEVAEQLNVHYMTAYKYVRTGRLAATKVKSIWNVDPVDLEAFLSTAGVPPIIYLVVLFFFGRQIWNVIQGGGQK